MVRCNELKRQLNPSNGTNYPYHPPQDLKDFPPSQFSPPKSVINHTIPSTSHVQWTPANQTIPSQLFTSTGPGSYKKPINGQKTDYKYFLPPDSDPIGVINYFQREERILILADSEGKTNQIKNNIHRLKNIRWHPPPLQKRKLSKESGDLTALDFKILPFNTVNGWFQIPPHSGCEDDDKQEKEISEDNKSDVRSETAVEKQQTFVLPDLDTGDDIPESNHPVPGHIVLDSMCPIMGQPRFLVTSFQRQVVPSTPPDDIHNIKNTLGSGITTIPIEPLREPVRKQLYHSKGSDKYMDHVLRNNDCERSLIYIGSHTDSVAEMNEPIRDDSLISDDDLHDSYKKLYNGSESNPISEKLLLRGFSSKGEGSMYFLPSDCSINNQNISPRQNLSLRIMGDIVDRDNEDVFGIDPVVIQPIEMIAPFEQYMQKDFGNITQQHPFRRANSPSRFNRSLSPDGGHMMSVANGTNGCTRQVVEYDLYPNFRQKIEECEEYHGIVLEKSEVLGPNYCYGLPRGNRFGMRKNDGGRTNNVLNQIPFAQRPQTANVHGRDRKDHRKYATKIPFIRQPRNLEKKLEQTGSNLPTNNSPPPPPLDGDLLECMKEHGGVVPHDLRQRSHSPIARTTDKNFVTDPVSDELKHSMHLLQQDVKLSKSTHFYLRDNQLISKPLSSTSWNKELQRNSRHPSLERKQRENYDKGSCSKVGDTAFNTECCNLKNSEEERPGSRPSYPSKDTVSKLSMPSCVLSDFTHSNGLPLAIPAPPRGRKMNRSSDIISYSSRPNTAQPTRVSLPNTLKQTPLNTKPLPARPCRPQESPESSEDTRPIMQRSSIRARPSLSEFWSSDENKRKNEESVGELSHRRANTDVDTIPQGSDVHPTKNDCKIDDTCHQPMSVSQRKSSITLSHCEENEIPIVSSKRKSSISPPKFKSWAELVAEQNREGEEEIVEKPKISKRIRSRSKSSVRSKSPKERLLTTPPRLMIQKLMLKTSDAPVSRLMHGSIIGSNGRPTSSYGKSMQRGSPTKQLINPEMVTSGPKRPKSSQGKLIHRRSFEGNILHQGIVIKSQNRPKSSHAQTTRRVSPERPVV